MFNSKVANCWNMMFQILRSVPLRKLPTWPIRISTQCLQDSSSFLAKGARSLLFQNFWKIADSVSSCSATGISPIIINETDTAITAHGMPTGNGKSNRIKKNSVIITRLIPTKSKPGVKSVRACADNSCIIVSCRWTSKMGRKNLASLSNDALKSFTTRNRDFDFFFGLLISDPITNWVYASKFFDFIPLSVIAKFIISPILIMTKANIRSIWRQTIAPNAATEPWTIPATQERASGWLCRDTNISAMWLAGSWSITKGTSPAIAGNAVKPMEATRATAAPVSMQT